MLDIAKQLEVLKYDDDVVINDGCKSLNLSLVFGM